MLLNALQKAVKCLFFFLFRNVEHASVKLYAYSSVCVSFVALPVLMLPMEQKKLRTGDWPQGREWKIKNYYLNRYSFLFLFLFLFPTTKMYSANAQEPSDFLLTPSPISRLFCMLFCFFFLLLFHHWNCWAIIRMVL